jgi:hypothetical protein
MKRSMRILSALALSSSLLLAGCPLPLADDCELTAFALAGVSGTIDQGSIAVTVPWGTDVASLAADFTTTGVSVSIGSTALESGVTTVDYTDPLTLTVHAEDGSTKEYLVTVTLPDSYEPNESMPAWVSLGEVPETEAGKQWVATISPAGDHDFYRFHAWEDGVIGIPLSPELFKLTVRLVPPQSPHARNYDLYVYNDGATLLGQSTNTGSAEDTVVCTWEGTVGMDDSRYFRVEIRSAGGDFTCCPYTLHSALEETY